MLTHTPRGDRPPPPSSPFSFAFFPPLSPPGASGEHTHTDGGGGGLTHADTRTGERTAKEAEVGGGRWWKKGAKGRRRVICPTSNSKNVYFSEIVEGKESI